jgi:hypothetical protein
MKPTEQRRIRTFLPASRSLAGMKSRTCVADLLCVKGTGAPKNSRRLILSVLATTLGALAFTAAPALAAAPEAPTLAVEEPVRATEAIVHGVLNPGKTGEPGTYEMGTYQFLYKASKTKACEGESVAPVPPGMSLGGGKEEVSEALPALTANTEYAVCLEVETADGKTVSAPVTFKTAILPEKPTTTSPAQSITATTATLEGVLNPVKAGEAGSYEFLYRVSPSECEGEGAAPSEPSGVMTGAAKQAVSVAVKALQPNTTYTFCLLARNAAGETALGSAVHFTTKAAAPTVESEGTSTERGINSTSAFLEAQVNPNNEQTTAHLQYSTSSAENGSGGLLTPTVLPSSEFEGYGGQSVDDGLTGLPAGTTFYYQAVATNAAGTTYGAVQSFTTVPSPTTTAVSAITSTTATFNGTLTPLNSTVDTEYSFDYRVKTQYQPEGQCTGEGATTPASAGTGSGAKTVSTEVTGLSPNTQYTVCLIASNTFGSEHAAPVTFATPIAPLTIASESATVVSTTETQLEAEINTGNSETTYHFEYGPSAGSYNVSVPVVAAHAHGSLTPKSVSAAATGLAPGTTYHYRVVASNALAGVVDGSDQEFTTPAAQPSGSPTACPNEHLRAEQPYGLALPDCRAYEMVSPPNTNGNDATEAGAASSARASAPEKEGEPEKQEPAIAYPARGSFGDPTGALVENQYVSRRTPTGWSTQAVTPLSSTPAPGEESREGNETSYLAPYFTPELNAGLALTSARLDGAPSFGNNIGVYVAQFASHAYQYVGPVSSEGTEPPWGASTNLERVVLTNQENGGLLEWVSGTDVPVSISNGGQEMEASAGSLLDTRFEQYKDAWHATSEDGSRVYFTTPAKSGQLYVRVNIDQPHIGKEQSELNANEECTEPTTKACTITISAAGARYWGANAEGTKVFYTENEDLYEYSLPPGQVSGGQRTAITDGGEVQGVVQISEEGSYVYFVAKGALKGTGASEQQCRKESEGEEEGTEPKQTNLGCNLYVSQGDGAPVFVAKLAYRDRSDWLNGFLPEVEADAGPETNTAVVNPAGSQLAFTSERSLPAANFPAGYDNEQAQAGECEAELENNEVESGINEVESGMCREVYLYDTETHGLVCASCNPTGARPVGPASIPGVQVASKRFGDYRPRDLLADGSLFFDSKDALVPHASDGRENVYEYEDGAVHAISNVAGGDESFFLDAGPSGENVFFVSADKLLPEDPGGNAVVWDARIDGGFPVVSLPASCDNADSCKAPESPQPGVFAPPASSTFSGPGNPPPPPSAVVKPAVKPKTLTRAQKLAKALKGCAKDKQKSKRAKCQKQAKQKYSASKAKKSVRHERGRSSRSHD